MDLLETFLVYMYSSLQRFWPTLFFLYFEVLCKSISTELNANEIGLYTLYSMTEEVQLMFIAFNTICPEQLSDNQILID